MPTPAPTPTPTKTDQSATAAGSGVHRGDELRERDAERDAEDRADGAQRRALDEELAQDVAASRAERLADPDLARPLGDGDEHDVHDHDGADDEADGRKRDAGDHEIALDLVPELERRIGRLEREVVRLRRAQMVARAHDLRAPPPSSASMPSRLGAWIMIASITPCGFTKRLSGDVCGATTNLSNEMPKTLPCFSITPITVYGHAAHAQLAADGIEGREEVVRDVLADDDHRRARARTPAGENRRPLDGAIFLMSK